MSYFGDTAGTYISSSFHSNFETPAETQEDSLADDHHPDDGQYDFLSFLALISRKTAFTAWTSLATNSVHITPSNIRMSEKLRHGSYFSVSLATRKDFVKLLPAGVADYQIPQLVAVKTPILDKNLFSRKSRRIFDSMVREYQILNHEYLRKHQNIVSIIGCCWRTVDADTGLTVPNLVLEGAELGDLEHFYRRYDNEITVRKRLGLCIDVATGVEALYMAGIVHGDIKPRNILVFKNRDRGFIAKIADFGSSIFLHNTSFPRRACIGTREFAAPETVDSSEDFGMEDLCRSEIYSLGIVLLFIVKGSLVLDKLFSVNGDVLKQQKFRGDLRNWIQRDQEQPAADCMTRETFGKNAIERERQKVIWDWHDTQMTRMFSASQKREGYSRHQNLVDDEGWITLQNTNFRSQHGERLFNSLLDEMTAGKSSARPGNPSYVLQMLRKILRSELRIIYDSNQFDQSREEKRYMTLLQRFNPTALNAGSSISTLNSQEIEEIVLNYFVSEDRKASFLRELCFLWRHGRIAKYPAKHRSPITGRLKRRVIVPTSKKFRKYADKQRNKVDLYMKQSFAIWLRYKSPILLNPSIDNIREIVFQASLDERFTSSLPRNVRQRVIRQLKYVADSPDECEDRRIVASFEYAIMILCYPDIYESDTSLLPTALQYLHYAATSGYQAAQGIDSQMHNIFGYKYPLSPSVEIEKLVQASLGGSLTAMMRLRRLSPTRYSETHRLIPFGHNESSVKCELRREIEPILKVIRTGVIDPPSLLIHQLVKLGQLENLKSLSDLSVRYFNEKNSLGETPLLVACQYGYADIVALLLALGADPSMGTYSHVHPLHFLGAFDDKDIPEVAALLVQHGASLEAHSREGKIYHKGIDSQFGMEEGTPLLWAVHAANFVAIETLLQLGADIFAYKQVQQWSFSDDTIIHPSPLEQAICSYRYDMVELLLTSCSRPEILSRKLNQLRLVGRDLEMTPLFLALHRRTLSTLTATVVHGRQIKLAQLKTVETLLRYGADPLKLTREADGSSLSPMVVVCQHDNLPLLHFLWQYGGGILRPSSGRVFFQSILYAMQQSNKDMFNFLVTEQHHMNALDDMHVWGMRALEKACDVSDIHYLSALITNMPRKVLSSSSSSSSSGIERRPDLTKQLIIALSAANLEAAYLFSQHGHCDLTQQMDGSSLLSFFIMFDANHPIAKNRVGTILSLAASFDSPLYKDWLFWNCQELGGTQLTALHFAFLRQKFEITGELMVPAEINKIILSNLIQYFHEPDMLNAKIDSRSAQYAGDTAFHLAAREGCMTAIRTLLESTYSVGSIDLNILNAYNQSPTDLFIMYYENLFNDLKDGLLRSGSLSTEWSLTRKLDEAENILFRLLHDHNCRISVFCLTAVRLSDDSFMFVRRPNTIINASYTNVRSLKDRQLSAEDEYDISQLLQLGIGRVIPFVDSISDHGKVLSNTFSDLIQTLI